MDDNKTEFAVTPALPTNPNLAAYWTRSVAELATLPDDGEISPEEQERHRLYSLLTMAITAFFWNGNKRGQDGVYPWRAKQRKPNGSYAGDGYLGHNIACIAVSGTGEVIDFDFNHNEIFNSSAEHAEARLVRRIFNLNEIYDHWDMKAYNQVPPTSYGTVLSSVTIYTSLESCAQCSGIMTLGNVKAIVYLQTDPGQYSVGNILFNLTRPLAPMGGGPGSTKYGAPLPIDAARFGLEHKVQLDNAFAEYARKMRDTSELPFFQPTDTSKRADRSSAITSFLCTDASLDIFSTAEQELNSFVATFPQYQPSLSTGSPPSAFNNAEVLDHVRAFLTHVKREGRRGTPHR